jgi:hypothetical protein
MASFFGGGATGPTPLSLAKIEAEVLTEMFNKYGLAPVAKGDCL